MANDSTPLTLEALEGILGRRNDGEKLFGRLDDLAQSLQAMRAEISQVSARLAQAEEADRRHERAEGDHAAKIELLRTEIVELRLATAVDRVRLSTMLGIATLVCSAVVSWVVSYVLKTPSPSKP